MSERLDRGQEWERARRLRTPRFVLQVVKDEAVGGEGGDAARLAPTTLAGQPARVSVVAAGRRRRHPFGEAAV